jgi:predicted phosphoribosyltransferase
MNRVDSGTTTMLFRDRLDAGQALAERLAAYRDRPDVVVLGLPRGGVPVAFEVAWTLHAPLDVFIVRKLGVPGREELAMGAIASGGVIVQNDVVDALGIPEDVVNEVIARERAELERRERLFRGDRPAPAVAGRIVILVDDGVATGASMRAAIAALRRRQAGRIVAAVPVGAAEICAALRSEADEAVCAETPQPFYSVGIWYDDFSQTTDDQVREMLERAAAGQTAVHQQV